MTDRNSTSIFDRIATGVRRQGLISLPGKAIRLGAKLLKQATFRPYLFKKTFQDQTLDFWIADLWAESWYTSNSERSIELGWVREQLRPGDFFVDCGAHHGLVSLLAAKWVGETGGVATFEALPQNYEVIQKNIALNNISNIALRNVAAGSEKGEVYVEFKKFGFLKDSNGTIRPRPHSGTITVPVQTLDEALAGSPNARVLKIDVEGFELEVIKGASKTIARSLGLDLELHCSYFDNPEAVVSEIFERINIKAFEGEIQLKPDDELQRFDAAVHSPLLIGKYDNVHLFLNAL